MQETVLHKIINELSRFIQTPNAMRSLLILVISILVAYWLSHFIARLIVRGAQLIAVRSDNATNGEKKIQLRRVETYLSVSVALIRALIVGVVAFYTWQLVSPGVNISTAAIGASAFFVVVAGATIGMVLRDITAGSAMIIERWFDIGDFIRVEPFMEIGGVVEQMTLRSTKLRSLNGEVTWLHNQHIQAVKVTPGGLRRIAVDVFANNEKVARTIIEKAIATMPVGTLKLTKKPKIEVSEQWSEKLWHFTIVGETMPGREWLMENYFTESLNELEARRKGPKTFVRPHIARFADPQAEKSFKRAIRISSRTQ